jgi:hypothetical protein
MKTASKAFPAYSTVTDSTGTYTDVYDIFTIGAGYLNVNSALQNYDTVYSSALSPQIQYNPLTSLAYVMPNYNSVWWNTPATHAAGGTAPTIPSLLSSCSAPGNQLTCLSGNTTVILDEAQVQRTNTVNGLGWLTSVIENSLCNSTTNYGYDVLGNLTSVNHAGYTGSCTLPPAINPARIFVYDSLDRLKTATNPESSGNTGYTYDNNSNLHTRTDGQGRTATCAFDALNRLTGKTYSDTTPTVTYSYIGTEDFPQSVSSSASSYTYSNYDALGRPGARRWSRITCARHACGIRRYLCRWRIRPETRRPISVKRWW